MSEYSGVEGRDINDADILNDTKQERDKKGNIRFNYLIADGTPTGHKIQSEWINPDNKRQAILTWVDVVRQTIVAKAQESHTRKSRSPIILPDEVSNAVVEQVDYEAFLNGPADRVVEEEPERAVPPPTPKRKPTKPQAPIRRPTPKPAPIEVYDEPEQDDPLLAVLYAKREELLRRLKKLDTIIELYNDI